jgi:hypothetical protein
VSKAPRLRIEPFRTEGTSDNWTVRWKLINEGDRPIRLLSAQHPHSQFRTPHTSLDRDVAPREETDIVLPVRFTELPGVMVENPFLILVFRQGGDWRLLARVQVTASPKGEPLAGQSVVVTMQRVGTP